MEAIEGDGSHWSYLSASIFMREINEFGASWHGCSWSTHEIIDKNPSDYFSSLKNNTVHHIPNTKADKWIGDLIDRYLNFEKIESAI